MRLERALCSTLLRCCLTNRLGYLGDHHRKQRKLLNPVFSIANMRRMIPIFNDVACQVRQYVVTEPLSLSPRRAAFCSYRRV